MIALIVHSVIFGNSIPWFSEISFRDFRKCNSLIKFHCKFDHQFDHQFDYQIDDNKTEL